MKRIKLDKSGEHLSLVVIGYTDKHGITLNFPPPYPSQSNDSWEQLFQEVCKIERKVFFQSRMNENIWTEAFYHSNWLRNGLPANIKDFQVPYTLWHGTKPDMSPVFRFGQPRYPFQYRWATAQGKKFLPRIVYRHFSAWEAKMLYIAYFSVHQ